MEALTITTPAATLPISVADLKTHMRITHSADDDYITDLAWMAYAWIEREADITISETSYSLVLSQFDPVVIIPKPPVQSLDSLTYYDTDNQSQSLSVGTDFYLVNSTKQAAMLTPVERWPSVFDRPDAINIEFTCESDPVPHQVPHLMRLLVGAAYEFREGEITLKTEQLKLGVDRLVKQIMNVRYV
ncbi:head-tail connector protein [Thalassoglobus sp.]|uniref:head-tail connector protein n=1 Tax=Thalassoglobus sp. TaxID=2795869 RepID=UPI003AA7B8FF